MKILDMLKYMEEPKSRAQLRDKFGYCDNQLGKLVAAGCVKKFEGVADHPEGVTHKHLVVLFYQATGKEYELGGTAKFRGENARSIDEKRAMHKEHKKTYYEKVRQRRHQEKIKNAILFLVENGYSVSKL